MKIDIGTKIKDIAIISSDKKTKLSEYLDKDLIIYFADLFEIFSKSTIF